MQNPQKILIIRFSSIGDIVLASPLIRGLRSRFPRIQIDFLVKSEYADLVRFNHHLSSVIELRTSTFQELRALRSKIRQEQYDVILDLHDSWRSRFVRILSGAEKTFCINKRAVKRFALIQWKWNLYNFTIPVAERYLETAQPLGVGNDGKGLEIFIPDEVLFDVSSLMGKYRLEHSDVVVGMAPSAKHNTKMWLKERFAEVALRLAQDHNARMVLFGGPEDADRCSEIAKLVNTAVASEAAINLAGRLSILETAAALDFCDVVLCNDTGIMHVAAARQRNVVAIFGPTVKEFGFFPYGTNAVVVEHPDLPCRPCTHIGSAQCPQKHFRCMKDITVEQVLETISSVLVHQQKPA